MKQEFVNVDGLKEALIKCDQLGRNGLIQVLEIIDKIKTDGWNTTDKIPTIPEEFLKEGYNRIEILVTLDSDVPVQLAWYDINSHEFYDDWDFLSYKYNSENILAWQYLPKKYKGEC